MSANPRAPFQYQLLPSAFQLAEAPTYFAWKLFLFAEQQWSKGDADSFDGLKKRTFAVFSGIGGYLGGMAALPITLACTPVTIVADIVVGIAECSFCYYHGLSGNDLKKIAHRKFIIAPLQQATFCAAAISAIIAIHFIFSCVIFYWPFGYALGQVAISKLPSHLNHRSFNIFINGGSGEEPGKNWLGEDYNSSNSAPSENSQPNNSWEEFIASQMAHLSPITDAGVAKEYVTFKERVFAKKSARDLLGLQPSFSKEELKAAFHKLAPLIHPDKNNSSQESSALFKILIEALRQLD